MAAATALGVTLGVTLGLVAAARCFRARWRPPGGPRLPVTARLVAHRGGAGERIENTLEAFENAVANGAQLLELDCHMTRDRVVVVSHDHALLRQSGRGLDLSQLRFRDLPPYKCPLEVTFDPGHFASGCDLRIPRLDDVFRRFPRVPISIEIKEDNDDLINEVAALVRRHARDDITLWASFREPILRKCRRAHPSMPFAFSLRRGLWVLVLHYAGLLPFAPLPEAVLLLPLPSIINSIVLRPPLFHHLRSRGVQVILWVLNEERDFDEAFAAGASGVMTDYPTRLRHYLRTRPSPPEATPTPLSPAPTPLEHRPSTGKGPPQTPVFEGVYGNCRMLHVLTAAV
ncbi:lysophospholipase D GDPD3-like, partial [Aegotheles albertisi]